MNAASTRLREVLIKRGRVIAVREQSVGSLVVYLVRPITGTVLRRELLLSWMLITLGSTGDLEECAGVRLYLPPNGDLMREQECLLDVDEVNEFIDGIDFVASARDSLSNSISEKRDLYYSSREDARVGVYKGPGESSTTPYLLLASGGDVHFFTSTKSSHTDESTALCASEGDEFAPLRSLVAGALSQLMDVLQK